MPKKDYFYSIQDTPKKKVNAGVLDQKIRQSKITKALDGVTVDPSMDQIKVSFKEELLELVSNDEKLELDNLINNHDGDEIKGTTPPITSDFKPRIQIDPREGSSFSSLSVNWCDKTTWYEKSENVVDEILIVDPASNNKIWKPIIERAWVDVSHGKITGERLLRSKYKPVIKVNNVSKIENEPDSISGDYNIDYRTGIITFNDSLIESDVVSASYYCVTSSEWTVIPKIDKKLDIVAVEVQFSNDIVLEDTVVFAVYGYVDHFAPQLINNVDPDYSTDFPSQFKIPIHETCYQTMDDYVNEAQRSHSIIPQLGGNNWRAMKTPQYIFRWPYDEAAIKRLSSKKGMEVRIRLENDKEFGGNKAVATFYGISEND